MKRAIPLLLVLAIPATAARADVVAQEDFDGGDVNLISSTVPALDGGPGDYFGVGSRNAWPQGFDPVGPGVPFGIGDDSVFPYSEPANPPFPDDTEGVYGENSNLDNNFFAISDSDEFGADQTASWEFDVAGFENLVLSIDMGGISNDSFGGYDLVETDLLFTVSVDAGAAQVAFDVDAVDPTGFVTRPMDLGTPSGGGALLVASGDNPVTKILADTGGTAGDTFFDKSVPSGAGAGEIDTFSTAIDGFGASLVVTFTANVPFEAAVFDNIVISGDPIAVPVEDGSWGKLKNEFVD